MRIEIDNNSGFCFGVMRATSTAESELEKNQPLYCLGDIVHNGQEVDRLTRLGLITIDHTQLAQLHDVRVLLRAHGEPPHTYELAQRNNITIIDATCPVVLKLQQKIHQAYTNHPDAQIVIYGKIGHAEVIGLEGQTNGKAIVIEDENDLSKIDFSRPIILFSQTTKSIEGFNQLVNTIKEKLSTSEGIHFEYHDTICRNVANRIPNIRHFASQFDIILFVAGAKSSNGKVLFNECLNVNPRTYLVSSPDELQTEWFNGIQSVGICGATSTPKWLMEAVKQKINSIL
ncbi:MAG: 4-hydroxy-3-methylbut-2-enyl diphosphate reductase [Paludibacteraceae bacterium]|nr:4-hydroxy-3-methylbut-2-enyl diphosphate reductase [Paludibacteraceae bacterium]